MQKRGIMRRLLVVFTLLLVLGVAAQEVTITLSEGQPQIRTTFLQLFSSGVRSYFIGNTQLISSVNVRVISKCSGLSSATICVSGSSNMNTPFCALIPQGFSQESINIPINPFSTNTLYFTVTGAGQFCQGNNIVTINQIEWVGGSAILVKKNIGTLSRTSFETVGRVGTLISAGGKVVSVATSNPKLVAWFTTQGQLSETSRVTTINENDDLLICLNEDQNSDSKGPICDFVDARVCTAKNSEYLTGDCCGDAPFTECVFHSSKQAFCGRSSLQKKVWAPLSRVGVIADLGGCPGLEVVSDGSKFLSCATPPAGSSNIFQFQGSTVINGHEYICNGNRIIECGANAPRSAKGAKTGARIVIGGDAKYCTSGGAWATSLDSAGQASCEAASLTWTGTKCCGELNDPVSTYQDTSAASQGGNSGGCFKNQFVPTGRLVPGSNLLLNYKGNFVFCDVGGQSALFDGTGVSPTLVSYCGLPLKDAKQTGTQKNAICLPSGDWAFTSRTDEHFKKKTQWVAPVGDSTTGCCPDNQCWNGKKCLDVGQVEIVNERGFKCQ